MNAPKAPLDKDQLIFVCHCILSAAMDRLDGEEYNHNAYARGALESAGMALATLYAQITNDGMGIVDALEVSGFYEAWNRAKTHIDCQPYAEKFASIILEDAG